MDGGTTGAARIACGRNGRTVDGRTTGAARITCGGNGRTVDGGTTGTGVKMTLLSHPTEMVYASGLVYMPPATISTVDLRRAALLASELSYQQIAEREIVSTETVKSTMKRLRAKLGKRTGAGVVIELQRMKLLVWDRDREYLIPNDELYK